MSYKKTVCLDFDGVVHQYTSPWQGAANITDPIMPGAISFMLMMLAAGWNVCIFSTRTKQQFGLVAMANWLKKEAGQTWYETPAGPGLEDVLFPEEKPPAILYIDDRGFTFQGVFPTLEFMENFQPWKVRPDIQFSG